MYELAESVGVQAFQEIRLQIKHIQILQVFEPLRLHNGQLVIIQVELL